jgi:hypothetical protein
MSHESHRPPDPSDEIPTFASATSPDSKPILQVIGGALVSAAVAGISGLTILGGWRGLIVGGVVIALLIAAIIRVQRQPRRHYFAIGTWIGLGVGLLAVGICTYSFNRGLSEG